MSHRSAAALYTGGKDSTFACLKALSLGYDLACLITIISSNQDSYMFHTPNIELTSLGAKAMDLPNFVGTTQGRKEEELLDMRKAITEAREKYGFQSIVSGAIASLYQKERIEAIAKECGLQVLSPLWGVDQEMYLRRLVDERFEFVLTSVSAAGLDDSWLGGTVGPDETEELIQLARKYRFNPAFEGGEAETLVLDCPLFKKGKIRVIKSEVRWDGYSGRLIIEKSALEPRLKFQADKFPYICSK